MRLLAVCAVAVVTPAPAQPGGSHAIGTQPGAGPVLPAMLSLYVGQAHVINEPRVRRIAVGNGKVIQATALDDRQILVLPEAPGQSTLYLWGKDGLERNYVINVLPADSARLLAEVQAMIGDTQLVSARVVGDKVLIEGANVSEELSARLAEIGKRYPQVVNLVAKVGMERMIAMDVRMIEIRRDLLENIGVKWPGSAQGPSFQIIGDLHRSNALRPGGAATGSGLDVRPYVAPFATSLSLVSSLTAMLNFMVQNGDAVILAEPRLSCRSGGTARFVAGGELPIPISGALGQASVSFKEYGVKFDVSPVASESGVIAAKIATEISAINFEVNVQNVPGLIKRRAETDVNLRENETLVIAGLLTEEGTRSLDKVAGAGELPILGKLFRSRLFRDRQTELVVLITPRFVGGEAPMPAVSTAPPASPVAPVSHVAPVSPVPQASVIPPASVVPPASAAPLESHLPIEPVAAPRFDTGSDRVVRVPSEATGAGGRASESPEPVAAPAIVPAVAAPSKPSDAALPEAPAGAVRQALPPLVPLFVPVATPSLTSTPTPTPTPTPVAAHDEPLLRPAALEPPTVPATQPTGRAAVPAAQATVPAEPLQSRGEARTPGAQRISRSYEQARERIRIVD